LELAHRYAVDYELIWWITAEQPTSVTADLAALAEELGIERVADQAEMVTRLFRELRSRDQWLLIYDNAERPEMLEGLLPPGGGGQVLVTSRYGAWGKLGSPLRLDVLARDEAVAFLQRRVAIDKDDASALAGELGDLPLALEEAAAYLEETHIDVGEYLNLVRERARELFGLDQPAGDGQADQRRVATIWSLSLERVHQEAPAAEALLRLCAFLAPEDIPRQLPFAHPEVLPGELAQVVVDLLAYNRLLATVSRFSLATVTRTSLGLHRLVQAVIQARLGHDSERDWAKAAVAVLRVSFPNDSWEVDSWAECGRLLPHVLMATEHAARLEEAGETAGWLLDRASMYLRARGLYRQAQPVAERALVVTITALGSEHAAVAECYDELGRVLQLLGDFRDARVQYERALAIGEIALGADHPNLAAWRRDLGSVLRALGDLPGAKAQDEGTIDIDEVVLGPAAATSRGNLGNVLWALGDLPGAQAVETAEMVLGPEQVVLGPEQAAVAMQRDNLGMVLRDAGDLTGARARYERAIDISEAARGPNHPDVAFWRNNLGNVIWALGDFQGSRIQHERAVSIGEASLGPNHPDVAIWRNNLGMVLQDVGDLAGARVQHERAVDIGEAAHGPYHPGVAASRNNLGKVLWALGDLQGSQAEFERAIEIGEVAVGPGHTAMAIWRSNLSRVLRALGDLAGAKAQSEQALAISEASLGPDHSAMALRRNNLGVVLRALGDLAGAKAQSERALAIGEATLGPDHPNVAVYRANLAGVLRELGETAEGL
jgi:tetratricopeptide (TPR) repeat protein